MNKLHVACVLAALSLSGVSNAVSAMPGHVAIGKLTAFDEATRTFTIEDDGGGRHGFYWDESTVFLSRPDLGTKIKVHFELDDRGEARALRVGLAEKQKPQLR